MQAYGTVDLELLKALSEVAGIGGCERQVSRLVKDRLGDCVDSIEYDNMGSIICLKKGQEEGPKVMISAHMDEVGFMVRSITAEGYLNLLPVGGWWGHVMPAQEMEVTTTTGQTYIGVVGSRAPHGMPEEEKNKVILPMVLYLDMGVASQKEIADLGIDVGDMITPHVTFRELANPNYLLGKAWDDRICLAVAMTVMENLAQKHTVANVYMVGSTQEEVGIRGARTAVHTIKPDIAIALDVTTAKDTPLDKGGIKLGCGVILSVLDSLTLANRSLLEKMEALGLSLDLSVNYDYMTEGGTDACNIHKAMEGIVTMTLSLPTRYMHSSRLLVHRKDFCQTVELLTAFCSRLDWEMLTAIKEGNTC